MDPTKNMFGVWIQSIDTVNLDVSKHVLGMDMDVSEKNWGTVPRSNIAFPFDDHLGPRPIFRETTIHTDDILIYPFSIRNKFTYYLSIILYMERYDYQ